MFVRQALIASAMTVTLASCATTAVDVGSNQPGDDAGYPTPVDDDGWPVEAACARGTQLPIVGTWDGWIENKRLPSGSDAIRLVITHANADHVCGTVTLGLEQPPWPSVRDPELPYPEDSLFSTVPTFCAFISVHPRGQAIFYDRGKIQRDATPI